MIYFDNAATTAIKPSICYKTLKEAFMHYSGNPGRGSHKLAMNSAEAVYKSRVTLAEFFGTEPEHIVFASNATHALNMAIKGIIEEKTTVITSNFEHNSVLRPLYRLRDEGRINLEIIDYDYRDSESFCEEISQIIFRKKEKYAVVMTFTSNVCGINLPVKAIGEICRKNDVLFIVDASQAAGHTDIKLDEYNIDILCSSGHKGLFGIMGAGLMAINRSYNKRLSSIMEGGSGVDSRNERMPDELPEALEAGTLSVPAIMTMASGVGFINSVGIENIKAHEKNLRLRIWEGFSNISRLTLYAANADSSSIILFNIKGIECDDVALMLSDKGICTRSGLHCAPLAHRALGCNDGAVRVSVGYFNNICECDMLIKTVYDISKKGTAI